MRFVTEGTQTKTKPYTYAPISVSSFSFEYCIENSATGSVDDLDGSQYIIQILCSDGSHPIIPFDADADGGWHSVTVDENTQIFNSDHGATYTSVQELFSGFFIKMEGWTARFWFLISKYFPTGICCPR